MCQHDYIALDVSGVTKRFVKSDGLRWLWNLNGFGELAALFADAEGGQKA